MRKNTERMCIRWNLEGIDMNLTYKKATIEDIGILTETRIQVLRAANHLSNEVDLSEVRKQSYHYYQKALCDGTHVAYLIFDEHRFASYLTHP